LFIFLFLAILLMLLVVIPLKNGWHIKWHVLAVAADFAFVYSVICAWAISLLYQDSFSAEGIYGHSFWGFRRFVRWQDVTSARTLRLFNLKFLRLYSTNGQVTWLALFTAQKIIFREEIRRLAPANNPVLNFLP
jgi:hypothetical protein